jgi:hypothetical protein
MHIRDLNGKNTVSVYRKHKIKIVTNWNRNDQIQIQKPVYPCTA